jgi:hypothetical protein
MSTLVKVRFNGSEAEGNFDIPDPLSDPLPDPYPTVRDLLEILRQNFEGHVDGGICLLMFVFRDGELLHPESPLHPGDVLEVKF